jgi:hypothetical protein
MITDEKKEVMKQTMQDELKFKNGEDFIEGVQDLTRETFLIGPSKKRYRSKKKATAPVAQNVLDESMEVDIEELNKKEAEILAIRKQLFRGIECDMSCYLFSKVRFYYSYYNRKTGSAFLCTRLFIMENLRHLL